MTAPPELIERVLPIHDTLMNCAPVVSQYAALAALRHDEKILKEVMPEYHTRRKIMGQGLEALHEYMSFAWPAGGYYFFPKIHDINNSEDLCFDMIRKAKVAAVPGSTCGEGGEGHIRLCFGRSREDITVGMERISDYFANGWHTKFMA